MNITWLNINHLTQTIAREGLHKSVIERSATTCRSRPPNHPMELPVPFVQKFTLARSLADQLETSDGKAFLFHRHLTFGRSKRLA